MSQIGYIQVLDNLTKVDQCAPYFRKDDASAASSTKTKAKTTTGVINQAVEEESSSEEENEDKRELPNQGMHWASDVAGTGTHRCQCWS